MGSNIKDGLIELSLSEFATDFATALPGLIEFLLSNELRRHQRWSRYVPYDVPSYSGKPSPGFACRPDIILTDDSPKITEIDFVASGRGSIIDGLKEDEGLTKSYLKPYADWYKSMQATKIYYATGTVTTCRAGTEMFSEALRRYFDIDISAVNIDECDTIPLQHVTSVIQ